MVEDVEADKYFDTRDYDSRINAWASEQSKILKKREDLLNKFKNIKKNFQNQIVCQDQ